VTCEDEPSNRRRLEEERFGGIDEADLSPVQLLKATAPPEVLEAIVGEPEMLRRLLNEIPLLGVLPGFSDAVAAGSDDVKVGIKYEPTLWM
jgi:hypothetical protein